MTAEPIPKTAPFAEDEIDILNRVVGPASSTQRAWLAGFLAGFDAGQTGPKPAASAQPAEPLTILFASESGNAERLAGDVAKAARKKGFKPQTVDLADLDRDMLAKARRLLVIASTWGEGEAPGRCARAYAELIGETSLSLDGVEFGVLALGDTAYPDFCEIGKRLDERLAAFGARRVVERVDCDLDFAKPASAWIEGALDTLAATREASSASVISVDFGTRVSASPSLDPVEAEIREHINLNSSRSGKETVHLELGFSGTPLHYEPGDALDLIPENDPASVAAILQAAGLAGDDALHAELTTAHDITTLSPKTLESFVAATDEPGARKLLDSGEARRWIAGRQVIDLLEAFPVGLSASQLKSMLRPLAARAYSIASARREFEDEAHLLVAAVRYESHGRARAGVASSFVIDRLKKGGLVKVKLRPNKHFRLPEPDTDIIMVGPGTGVAPFRAFVQERRALGAPGRNWLFFGDRQFTHDFLYQLEWQDALNEGALTRIDLAFSRDTPEKVYVQHRIWERRRDVIDWLDGGARFYVCGDVKHMAKDVRAMLVRAFADVKALGPEAAEQAVRELEDGRRYLQDVY
jgi:sulfite reductase (NADPH) flavoprotein alpha-component